MVTKDFRTEKYDAVINVSGGKSDKMVMEKRVRGISFSKGSR